MNTLELLTKFIGTERERFDVYHNNLFAGSFSEVKRYYLFLHIINDRYKQSLVLFEQVFTTFQKTINESPGNHTFTDEQMKIDRQMIDLMHIIQLDIESFYQFAKILLDKTTHAIEFYFGKRAERKNRIDSHHEMVERKNDTAIYKIQDYCNFKGLIMDQDLLHKMIALQRDINEFRDHFITHLDSPRTIRGMSLGGHMSLNRIYPKENEDVPMLSTKELNQLLDEISQYITLVIEFINTNNTKTALKLKS